MANNVPADAETVPPVADVIELQWHTGIGVPGEDSHHSNPLWRSVAHLFKTGRPFKTLAMSFLAADDDCRWFGIFVEGKHIIFFPGLAQEYDSAEMGRDGAISTHSFALDHLTLDLGQRKWHVTSSNREGHLTARGLHEIGGGRALWFGMAFDEPKQLRQLVERTTCTFDAPPSDSMRRRSIVRQAREGVAFPLMRVPDNPDLYPSYIHASVIVGPTGFPDYLGDDHAFPGNDLLAHPNTMERVRLLGRIHRVSLSSIDLQITLFRLPGQLRMPFALTAP